MELLEVELTETINRLSRAILQGLRKSSQSELDPLEGYMMHVQSAVFKDSSEFQKRFLEGYRAILSELSKES